MVGSLDTPGRSPSGIRVLVVDDYPAIRRALVTFVRAFADLQLAGEASCGEDAIDLCERVRPDVVLMDVSLPGMGCAATVAVIHQRWPATQIIALTSFQEEHLVAGVLRAGAFGHLSKNVSPDELAGAVRAAHGSQLASPSRLCPGSLPLAR